MGEKHRPRLHAENDGAAAGGAQFEIEVGGFRRFLIQRADRGDDVATKKDSGPGRMAMLQDLQERLARLMQPGPPARPLDPENAAPIVDVQHLQGGEHGGRVALQCLKPRFVEARQQDIVVGQDRKEGGGHPLEAVAEIRDRADVALVLLIVHARVPADELVHHGGGLIPGRVVIDVQVKGVIRLVQDAANRSRQQAGPPVGRNDGGDLRGDGASILTKCRLIRASH